MRIAMVSEHASPLAALGEEDCGGQNVHVAELSSALVKAGHDVTVYTRRDSPDPPEAVEAGGVRVVHVPAGPSRSVPKDRLLPYMGRFADFLADAWETVPPDVVHAHFWMSGLATLLAQRRDVPVVQTFHALGSVKRRYQGAKDTSPAERLRLERMIGTSVDRIAATCADEVVELVRMGVPRTNVSVVPCGVDVERFAPTGPIATRGARFRLLCVGRLVPRKGVDTVISALRLLPDAELVVAGGPERHRLNRDPEAVRLRALADRLGVADRVLWTGQVPREEMPGLFRSADAVVCTPWYEPFGIVPLEAMACAVPVVVAAVGGLADTVVDGVTGLQVPPRDVGALAAALRLLMRDEARRQSLGVAGCDRARARYTWERIAADTARVYEGLCLEPMSSSLAGQVVGGV